MTRWTDISLAIGLAVSSPLLAQSLAPISTAPPPLLIMIHGRGQTYQVSALLRETWFGALDDGLRKVASADIIPAADRRFVFYGDVFEHQTQSHGGCFHLRTGLPYQRVSFNPVGSPIARYFLSGDRTDLVSATRRVVGKIKGSAYLVASQLPDVLWYHDDRIAQCEVESRLVSLLDSAKASQRDVVIVAHSMGALVTFHTLLRRPATEWPRIRALVTIGSPLASPGMARWLADAETLNDIWEPPRRDSRDSIRARWRAGALHKAVGNWTNVLGRDDQLAYAVRDVPDLTAMTDTLHDFLVETQEGDEHAAVGYLKNPWVASAIVRPWCPPPIGYPEVCHLANPADSTVRLPPPSEILRLAVAAQATLGGLKEIQSSDTSSLVALSPTLYAFSPFFPGTIEYRSFGIHEKAKNRGIDEKPWLLARLELLAGVQFVWGKIGSYEATHWTRSSVRGWSIGSFDLEGSVLNTIQFTYLRQRDNQGRALIMASASVGWAPSFLRR